MDYGVPANWHDLVSARALWPDAPDDDETLSTLLMVGMQAVVAYAPPVYDTDGVTVIPIPDDQVPGNYREAQLMQARNVWNSTMVDPATGGIGDTSFVQKPFPLDWMVKQIIRPATALPWVG